MPVRGVVEWPRGGAALHRPDAEDERTSSVDGLEAAGLVERAPHPHDRRATLVTLTDDGTNAATALADDEHGLARFLFAVRPAPEPARLMDELDGLLRRLDDPAFAALRRSALGRRPLPRSPQGRASSRRSDNRAKLFNKTVE